MSAEDIEVVYERAKLSDYDEIMRLSETVYSGLDYLPACYNDWVEQDTEDTSGRHSLGRQ